jgi:hypothetical protein
VTLERDSNQARVTAWPTWWALGAFVTGTSFVNPTKNLLDRK